MEKIITVFEAFSGIGSQMKSLNNTSTRNNINIENIGICEWYIDSIIAYSKIHHLSEFERVKKKLDKEDIAKQEIIKRLNNIKGYIFSSDSKKPTNLKYLKEERLKELYVANIVSKNFGSIMEIEGKDIKKSIDIFTYSFPCQSISIQGSQDGLEKNSDTSSSLVWQVLRLLGELKDENNLPKVLLMENVKALFSNKFIGTWNEIKSILSSYGYNSYDTVINALNKGSIQKRERAFSVSILKQYDNGFTFNNRTNKRNNKTLKDILSANIDTKYYTKHLKSSITSSFKKKKSGLETLSLNYSKFMSENIVYSFESKSPTITASGANSRIKIIDTNNDMRELIPLELWKLMGFEEKDFLINKNMSDNTLRRLAGNSISVEVLEDIFEDILLHTSLSACNNMSFSPQELVS